MRITYGKQQGDTWIRNRIGRITGSRIADVCSYLVIKSRAGESSAKRNNYQMELIAERLTGRARDHYVSPAMEHGTATEDDARLYYEKAVGEMCIPVSFVLHPKYDFTGSSPDSLVGDDGVLEIKCPESTTHLQYVLDGKVPDEYLPQIVWELACTGREWADFVSFDPRIQDETLRFFYRRIKREDLEWCAGESIYAGEQVIEYFTQQMLKFEAEIQDFFAEHHAKPIAPYPVEIITEDGEVIEQGDPADFTGDGYKFIDQIEVTP